jgi:hypothetical protein
VTRVKKKFEAALKYFPPLGFEVREDGEKMSALAFSMDFQSATI